MSMKNSGKTKTAAIVLAAGSGSRMQADMKKQFMLLHGRPLIFYSLWELEHSFIDHIILVVSEDDIAYCEREIVGRYDFTKVKQIVAGGRERYHSVYYGLEALDECDYVFIQDGARPMLTREILQRAMEMVKETDACVVGMPVKDTIAILNKEGIVEQIPDRRKIWMAQTPQVFAYELVKKAYLKLIKEETQIKKSGLNITDDAMVVETFMGQQIKYVEGSYQNIKVTTPEDLLLAELFLKEYSVEKTQNIE